MPDPLSSDDVLAPLAPVDEATLAELIEMSERPEDDPTPRRWVVSDISSATWAMGRLASAVEEADRLRAEAADMVTAILAAADRRASAYDRTARFMHANIERWARDYIETQIARNPKAPKTITLATGEVVTRLRRPQVKVVDPDAFVEWAEANGHDDLVRVPPTPAHAPDANAIKQAFDVKQVERRFLHLGLDCGHIVVHELGENETSDAMLERLTGGRLDEMTWCVGCGPEPDPLEGDARCVRRRVVAESIDERRDLTTLDPTRGITAVPGLTVDPGGRDFTIVPKR